MNTWHKNENDSSFGMLQHKNNIPVLRYSNTPLLRSPEFEDDDEDSLPDVAPRFVLSPAQSRPRDLSFILPQARDDGGSEARSTRRTSAKSGGRF